MRALRIDAGSIPVLLFSREDIAGYDTARRPDAISANAPFTTIDSDFHVGPRRCGSLRQLGAALCVIAPIRLMRRDTRGAATGALAPQCRGISRCFILSLQTHR